MHREARRGSSRIVHVQPRCTFAAVHMRKACIEVHAFECVSRLKLFLSRRPTIKMLFHHQGRRWIVQSSDVRMTSMQHKSVSVLGTQCCLCCVVVCLFAAAAAADSFRLISHKVSIKAMSFRELTHQLLIVSFLLQDEKHFFIT